MGIRKTLMVLTVTLGVLSIAAALSLVILTTALHRSADALSHAMESIRLVEELQVALLTHTRLGNLAFVEENPELLRARDEVARQLRRQFAAMDRFSIGPEEDALIREAEEAVESYVTARLEAERNADRLSQVLQQVGRPLDRAAEALRRLVELNVAQAQRARASAEYWNELGNVLGGLVALALVLGVAATLWWLRAATWRPVVEIQRAMERFGAGDRNVRAAEEGPEELRDIARRFNEMADALGQQRQTQLAFLAGVAHDLRNPLGALKLTVGFVRPGRPLPDEESIRENFALVRGQVERLERMVGDFLDVARIEAGALELVREPHDLRRIVQQSVELYRPGAPQHDIQLVLPEQPTEVRCDALRVEQVVNNLLSNAIKYSPGGGRITVSVERTDAGATIRVSDEGIGISAEDQRRIFEPFRRGGVLTGEVPGAGLGLSVAQRIVAAHGGSLEVQSTPSHGSTFTVRLPATPV